MAGATLNHLAVCIPAHDEADSLRSLLPELDGALGALGLRRVSVYVFDDGSRDATADVLKSTLFSNAEVFSIQSRVRVGKAFGLQHCISAALKQGADVFVMMDADGQDDPAYIFDLLRELKSGLDVVNGRRVNRAHPFGKRFSSRAFNAAVRLLAREKIWDINSGLKGFSRRGAESLAPYFYGELHRVIIVIALWLGLSVGEIPVANRPRSAGHSKYGMARGWRGVFDLLTIQFLQRYHSKPGHFFSGVGFSFVVLGALFLVPSLASAGSGGLFDFSKWGGIVIVGCGLVFLSFGFLAELMLFLFKNPMTSVVTITSLRSGSASR